MWFILAIKGDDPFPFLLVEFELLEHADPVIERVHTRSLQAEFTDNETGQIRVVLDKLAAHKPMLLAHRSVLLRQWLAQQLSLHTAFLTPSLKLLRVAIAIGGASAYSGLMRVTGGVLRGRAVMALKGRQVRPTQDRVRLALFSSLAPRIPGCRFVDLFAGSGAVGLEAWSRGAAAVCWVEQNARMLAVLRRNVEGLCGSAEGGTWRVIRADALRFLESAEARSGFDIVFADPPYDRDGRRNWIGRILCLLRTSPALAPDGVFVMEQAVEEPPICGTEWHVIAEKIYGGTRLCLWRRPL
jgi:16S rRNA (guanine966-N2)-methyltransferase